MRRYKESLDGYILSIGVGNGFDEITEAEYGAILAAIHAKPEATDTTDYRLREDLTWEAYEADPPDPEPEEPTDADKAEAYDILMGVSE